MTEWTNWGRCGAGTWVTKQWDPCWCPNNREFPHRAEMLGRETSNHTLIVHITLHWGAARMLWSRQNAPHARFENMPHFHQQIQRQLSKQIKGTLQNKYYIYVCAIKCTGRQSPVWGKALNMDGIPHPSSESSTRELVLSQQFSNTSCMGKNQ